jgi:hypothetical protein
MVQVKGLTHMFCLWISSHKLYKQYVLPCLVLKCIRLFGIVKNCLTLNGNYKGNEISFWLLIPSTFSHSYLFGYLHKQVGASFLFR